MTTNTQEPDTTPRPAVNLGALCVVGKVREENQDRMIQLRLPIGDLCAVADGMGGHLGGAAAATIAVETIERVFREAGTSASPLTTIQKAIREANSEIHNQAATGKPEFEKMGSTAVVALIKDGIAHIGHVGDSRGYLIHKGKLTQLTEDHTVVQELVDAGVLTPEEALDHEDASKLTRVLGPKPDVDVDLEPPVALEYGDAILLCSDGLSGYVRDSEIQRVIAEGGGAQKIAEHVVDLAMQAGGEDNISVQFVRYGDAEGEAEEAEPSEEDGHTGKSLSAWKVAGFLVAAAFLGSAGSFAYLSLRTPPPPGPPAAHAAAALPAGVTDAGVVRASSPSDDIQRLQAEIKALTDRVEKLEALVKSAAPASNSKAGSGNQATAAAGGSTDGNKRGAAVRPAGPASGGTHSGAGAGANRPAGSTDQGHSPEPPQKTDPTNSSKGDPNQGGATKGDATKGDAAKGEPGKGESKKPDPEGKKQ